MEKKVKITADSPADLTPELAKRYDVGIVPLHVILGEESFEDGVNITPDDIYRFYDEHKQLPKTSAVTIGEYESFFKQYTDEGYEVVHFSLSSAISSTHANAVITAKELEGVYVLDSKSLSVGIAMLVIKAAEMRDEGLSAKEIFEKCAAMRDKVKCDFILDNLEFLHKGGRCSALAAFGANVLGIKPSIIMQDGVLSVGKKYRGKTENCYMQYFNDKLAAFEGRIDTDRIFVNHTAGVSPRFLERVKKELKKRLKPKEIIECVAGCTITAHCGKRTFSVIFMEK
jgi:DegV family protein with EDD domain